MLDLELLQSFVAVVDAGGFTRAGERVHRAQSTVSQQIKRLEDGLGRQLLHRIGKQVSLTEEGERLLSYARRILTLTAEARDVMTGAAGAGVVRLGVPEDFAAHLLPRLLAALRDEGHKMRLDIRAEQSVVISRALAQGELDLALFKRDAGEKGGLAVWPERLHWVTSLENPADCAAASVPLVAFAPGCVYRKRAIHAMESAGRSWHMAYTSANHAGVQAAVAAGLGFSILSEMSILPEHLVLSAAQGFGPIEQTEMVLEAAPHAGAMVMRLAERLIAFCDAVRGQTSDHGSMYPVPARQRR
jgi:DNA-binding transcriptional LysR family regulator